MGIRKGVTITILAGLLLLFSYTACIAAQQVIHLSLATQHPVEAPMNKVVNRSWAKWIEKESKGKVKITIMAAETASKAADAYDAARMGIVDMSCQFLVMTPGRFPVNEVIEMPLLFNSSRSAALTHMALFRKYKALQKEFRGVKVLGFHANGPAQVHSLKRPIKKMKDFKGEIIVGWGPYAASIIKSLGGTPEMIGPPELYDALAKGVIDSNMVEWEGLHVWHYNEVTRYSTEANLYLSPFVHVMNIDTYNRLPADIKEIFSDENMSRFFEIHGYNFDQDDNHYRASLDAQYKKAGRPGIYTLPKSERQRWVKAMKPVYDRWIKKAKKKRAPAEQILEDARRLADKFNNQPCSYCQKTLEKWRSAVK